MRTGPENRDAPVSWLWLVPPETAAELVSVVLRLDLVGLQVLVLELQVLGLKFLQQLWFLRSDTPKLEFLTPPEGKLLVLGLQILVLELQILVLGL